MGLYRPLILCIVLFFFSSGSAESLGTVELTDLVFTPTFRLNEPQHGEFELGSTSVSWDWKHDLVTGHLMLGSLELINRPLYFAAEPEGGLGVIEAYAQLGGTYGKVRLGLIPLLYGAEGHLSEGQLYLPRSLLYSRRIVGLRDLGFSYEIIHNGYVTRLAVHNGEAADNTDGRVWYTAQWGWREKKNLFVGVAGQTGTTKPISTAGVTHDLAGADADKEAKWRLGTVFVHWHPNNWNLLFEWNEGELIQESQKTRYSGGHIDLNYNWRDHLAFQFRYDRLDPNLKADDDQLQEITAGVGVRNRYDTSVVYIQATQVLEQGESINNNVYRIMWRLTPQIPIY